MASLSVPGKVFILGEYAVLAGQPAWVAAVGGRFRWESSASAPEFLPPALSPAGRLIARARELGWTGSLRARRSEDWLGQGGFGSSTAEYAFVFWELAPALGLDRNWESAWRLYGELHANEEVPPSGADLVAQWRGGVVLFDPIVPAADALDVSRFRWQVYSAAGLPNRKVATHEHLARLRERSVLDARSELVGELSMLLAEARDAAGGMRVSALGACMDRYAETLGRAGLEAEAARADRDAIRGLPGVAGVKGAGAMLADALIVLLNEDADGRIVRQEAERRGLRPVSQGLPVEPGLRED